MLLEDVLVRNEVLPIEGMINSKPNLKIYKKYEVRLHEICTHEEERVYIERASDIYEFTKNVIKLHEFPSEAIYVIHLSTKGEIIGYEEVSKGTIMASICSPREIYRSAILNNAARVAICHNHPSGDPTPSQEDYTLTERLYHAGKLLGVELLDHIVVTANNYFTFAGDGFLDNLRYGRS